MVTCRVLPRFVLDSRFAHFPFIPSLSKPANVNFFPFNRLRTLCSLFCTKNLITPLRSYRSTLFAQNTGGRYTPDLLPFIFSGLRTLQYVICSKQSRRARLFSIVAPLLPCIVASSVRCFQSLHGSQNTSHGTPLSKTASLDLLCALCALCGKFLFFVTFPCRPLLSLRSASSRCRPVGAPLFPHGKRPLSLFSSYRCQNLFSATKGVHPLPCCLLFAGWSQCLGASVAAFPGRNFFASGTSNQDWT
jgi:hypothetical protein